MMNIVLAILVDSFTEAQAELKHEQASTPSANHPEGMTNGQESVLSQMKTVLNAAAE